MSGRKFLSANILVDLMELEFKNDIVINLHRSMEVLIALAITAETFHVARILYACLLYMFILYDLLKRYGSFQCIK